VCLPRRHTGRRTGVRGVHPLPGLPRGAQRRGDWPDGPGTWFQCPLAGEGEGGGAASWGGHSRREGRPRCAVPPGGVRLQDGRPGPRVLQGAPRPPLSLMSGPAPPQGPRDPMTPSGARGPPLRPILGPDTTGLANVRRVAICLQWSWCGSKEEIGGRPGQHGRGSTVDKYAVSPPPPPPQDGPPPGDGKRKRLGAAPGEETAFSKPLTLEVLLLPPPMVPRRVRAQIPPPVLLRTYRWQAGRW